MANSSQDVVSLTVLYPNLIREGIEKEDVLKEYNKWATTYDKDLESLGYNAYQEAVRKMCELYPPETRAGIKVLDIAAGTGLQGLQLKREGFTHIDALDPSKDMMAEAEKKGVYDNYFIEFITEKPLAVEKDTYDVVIGTGMFGYSLVPYTAIYEMIRLTKPGGHVVLSNRKDNMKFKEYMDLEPTMDTLEREGKWMKVCRAVYPNFVKNNDGILYVYKLL